MNLAISLLEVKVRSKLALHFLEHRILCGGLSTAGQGLTCGARERGAHARDILDPHTKRADQLLDKVQGVRCYGGISN